jgi:eukaryotic-like serine/threonine-protein kinase
VKKRIIRAMQVGQRVGPYEICEVIADATPRAEGRYVARRAEEGACARDVALTLIDVSGLAASFIEVSLLEARVAGAFVHRNLARLCDIGLAGAHVFIATEHVAGATLAELDGRVPREIAIAIVSEVCAGLHYLHELTTNDGQPFEVVHRMVRPDHVLVGCDGSVKLLGGRYLWPLGSSLEASPLRDLLPYLSPEQVVGKPISRRSDIYALATVLWDLTLDAVRYAPELSDYELAAQIARRGPPPPSAVAPDYPPDLERIVLRALQRDPDARHATADELQADLEAFARTQGCCASARDIAGFMRRAVPERAARASRLSLG